MATYTFEVFGSDGAAAIQSDGDDILTVTRSDGKVYPGDPGEERYVMSDDEHTALLVLIAHAINPSAVAEDELDRARDIIHGD